MFHMVLVRFAQNALRDLSETLNRFNETHNGSHETLTRLHEKLTSLQETLNRLHAKRLTQNIFRTEVARFLCICIPYQEKIFQYLIK